MDTESSTDHLITFENNYVRAGAGKRFLNYIIDIIFFYVILYAVFIVIGLISQPTLNEIADSKGLEFVYRILGLVFYALLLGALEAIFKGKTPGKLLTRTRALNLDGSMINTGKAFSRGFCRAVPFSAFSALGTPCIPWQDKWTDTMVIDEKESEIHS